MPSDFEATADEVFDAEGEEEESFEEATEGEEEGIEDTGGESEDDAEEAQADNDDGANEQEAAGAYSHDQLGEAVRRAIQERDQAYAMERQRNMLEMQQLRQQIQQLTRKPKEEESAPKLPSLEEWIQAQGDPNLYRYLKELPQRAESQVHQVRQEIERFRAEQRQSQIEREIEQHFDSSIEKVAAESEHLKDKDGREFLDNIVYAQAMASMKRGIDPRRFDVAGTAKRFADYIDRMVDARVNAKVKKVTKQPVGGTPGRGGPTKPKKRDVKFSTDDLLDRGIDDLMTELGGASQ